ncbi:MAG: PHP domain-containing protein [Lachnospiraceae bacterium]|nr:PHP domain-containing protein [Lachnospiraceae bacterium]
MKTELHNYDIFPKVFIAQDAVKITIKPLGAHAALDGCDSISVLSVAHGLVENFAQRNNYLEFPVSTDTDGCIRFSHIFPEESEYLIRINRSGRTAAELSVYALAEDMRGRYPYRGDLHMHTCRSDGSQSPAVVVANYRRHGYDFTVISDHGRYYPSLEAIDAYQDVPVEMNIVAGEEIHLPGNDIHIVNFGSDYSVNGLLECSDQSMESDRRALIDNPPPVLSEAQYREEVDALAETLDIPKGIEKYNYASSVWAFNHIRKGGGLAIYPHPYWKCSGPYHVPETLNAFMTQTHPFDAFEVLGGENYYQQNGFQTLQYYEDRAKGIHYPIVGSTDSHNSIAEDNRNALVCSTFVFAMENEKDALVAAIKDEYSVAVDTISKEYRLVGDFRLAKYTRFLLDEFTPLHDELCFEEGRLMKAYVTGDEGADQGLTFVYGRMKKLYEKYFAV